VDAQNLGEALRGLRAQAGVPPGREGRAQGNVMHTKRTIQAWSHPQATPKSRRPLKSCIKASQHRPWPRRDGQAKAESTAIATSIVERSRSSSRRETTPSADGSRPKGGARKLTAPDRFLIIQLLRTASSGEGQRMAHQEESRIFIKETEVLEGIVP